MGLVHLPPFVGCGRQTSGEQESFVFSETGEFSQKSCHALPFFSLLQVYGSWRSESILPDSELFDRVRDEIIGQVVIRKRNPRARSRSDLSFVRRQRSSGRREWNALPCLSFQVSLDV